MDWCTRKELEDDVFTAATEVDYLDSVVERMKEQIRDAKKKAGESEVSMYDDLLMQEDLPAGVVSAMYL